MSKFSDEAYEEATNTFPHGTLAWVIQRVIEDVSANPDMKQFGRTKMGRLRMIQRLSCGAKLAVALKRDDFNEHAKMRRREDGIGGATAMHDLTAISTSLNHYASTWTDLDLKNALHEMKMSKKYLVKNGIISGSEPRTRLPEEWELEQILAKARERDQSPRAKIKCCEDFYRAGHVSGRRRGEVERMEFGDFFPAEELYWVRDMKHPTKKIGNDKPFFLLPALWEIVQRQPRLDPKNPKERVFKRVDGRPVNGNTMGFIYCAIKNELKEMHPGKFIDLRQHDNRADRLTRLLDAGMTPDEVKAAVSGHERTSKTLEMSYDRRKQEERMRPGVEKLKSLQARGLVT